MNIIELVNYRPQTAEIGSGPEPSIKDLVWRHYKESGCTYTQSKKFTDEYLEALVKEFSK